VLGTYRKSHVPDGPGYTEKYYFSPGDTGFRVWDTAHGAIGVGICWDQWFPEAARVMVLMGAELLLYPTAIGSEPHAPGYSSQRHWQRAMQGHAACNMVPVVASNRVGVEQGDSCTIDFYGSSFITNGIGEILEQAPTSGEAVLTAGFDLDTLAEARAAWGLFRDRRPDLYVPILSVDGEDPSI
jgi:N-carbamoylputrescine amidase